MVTLSKSLGAEKVSEYFKSELSNATSYYAESVSLRGEFSGALATEFGLAGQQVRAEQFDRLALGQNPNDGAQLIKHRDTIKTKAGEEVAHRAGLDLTCSAPKSISAVALVGGDERVIEAHRIANKAMLDEAEKLAQARMGGNLPSDTVGRWIVATFHHDTARPVDGYAAVQLHSHNVAFNMTTDASGQARSLDNHEFYVASAMLTEVYRNRLEIEIRKLGYIVERRATNAPEIVGFTAEYLASESRRSKEISDVLEEKGLVSARARSYAAYSTRGKKLDQSPEEVKSAHLANAARFGNQAQRIVAEAAERRQDVKQELTNAWAKKSVTFARLKLSERESVFEHHAVITQAIRHARGRCTLEQIQVELDRQKINGELIDVRHVRPNAPLYRYTTPEAIVDECEVIEAVVQENPRIPVNLISDESLAGRYPQLNEWQRKIIIETLGAEDRITGIQGSAGSGKSTSLKALRELAEESGWSVHGLAPTSQAARGLREVGIRKSETIAKFLIKQEAAKKPRLIVMDETSLAAARQLRAVINAMGPRDRMVIVGDRRQHDAFEAGRIFEELQLAGMKTARINKLVRQQDPALKEVIKAMAQGRTGEGVELLTQQGRIVSELHRGKRFDALAKDYASHPENCLVISPDNQSRHEINKAIRSEMQARGIVGPDVHAMRILVNRQDVTGQDRKVAAAYNVGDVVRYRQGSKDIGIEGQTYATVMKADAHGNVLTVKTDAGKLISYNPEKLHGVSIYEPEIRRFGLGDRVQFTAPDRATQVSNRDVGTIIHIEANGNVRVKLDTGNTVGFSLKRNRHVELGYVSTSHASQGATYDKVLLHVDTGDSRVANLVNQTLGYVGLSRAKYDAKIYTDSAENLGKALAHKVENSKALSPEEIHEYRKRKGMAA